MILYLDTSAIVKQFIEEPGSQEVVTALQQAEIIGTAKRNLDVFPQNLNAFLETADPNFF